MVMMSAGVRQRMSLQHLALMQCWLVWVGAVRLPQGRMCLVMRSRQACWLKASLMTVARKTEPLELPNSAPNIGIGEVQGRVEHK